MKASALLPWVLAGGLAASTVFNLLLMRRLDAVEASLSTPTPTPATDAALALPGRIISKLGLTDQQCARIVDSSVD
jgi:hypothetical protein